MSTTNQLSGKTIIKWIACFGIPLLLYLIPANDVYTPQIRMFAVIGIWFLLCAALEIMPQYVYVFLTPVLWMLSGCIEGSVAFSGWVSPIMWVIVGAFLLAAALSDCGLLNRISYWLIIKVGGTLTRTCWALFIIGFVLCTITFSNAYVLMAPFTYGVAKAMNIKMPSKEGMAIMTSAILGVLSTRLFIYAPTVILMLQQGSASYIDGYQLAWYKYCLYNLPTILFLLGFMFFMIRFYHLKDYKGNIDLSHFEQKLAAMGKMTVAEKKGAIGLIIVAALLFSNPITHISTNIPFLLIPILFYVPGINVGNPDNLAASLNFSMLSFIATCMSLGTACGTLGIGGILVKYFSPMIAGHSTWVVIMGILLLATLANFAMTPAAMLVALSGPFCRTGSKRRHPDRFLHVRPGSWH